MREVLASKGKGGDAERIVVQDGWRKSIFVMYKINKLARKM